METAQRLYQRLGFVAVPERDWGHVEVHLRVHTWTPPDAPGALVESATWPPARVVDVDGWRVGLSGGLTRRANSVLPLGTPPDVDGDARPGRGAVRGGGAAVDRARVPGGAAGLDDLLALRGYEVMSRTDVLVRELDGIEPRRRRRAARPLDRCGSSVADRPGRRRGSRRGPARRPGCTPPDAAAEADAHEPARWRARARRSARGLPHGDRRRRDRSA